MDSTRVSRLHLFNLRSFPSGTSSLIQPLFKSVKLILTGFQARFQLSWLKFIIHLVMIFFKEPCRRQQILILNYCISQTPVKCSKHHTRVKYTIWTTTVHKRIRPYFCQTNFVLIKKISLPIRILVLYFKQNIKSLIRMQKWRIFNAILKECQNKI